MKPMRALSVLVAVALLPSRPASATGQIPCGRVDPDVIHVDGLLDDWRDVEPLIAGGGDQRYVLAVKCNYDDDSLYLLADVQDGRLTRSRKAATTSVALSPRGRGGAPFPPEDGVEFVFEDAGRLSRLIVLPGDADRSIRHVVAWAPPRPGARFQEADALQREGWAVELKLPLSQVPGWFAGAPSIHVAVASHDADQGRQRTLATSPIVPGELTTVAFGEGARYLESFLRDRRLARRDIRFDRVGRGTGRVVVAGRTLAFVGQDWYYRDLPVASPADILDVQLIDLAGDGHDSAVVRYRERGGSGAREVLAAYRVTSEGLNQVFGVEVAKSQGANRVACKVGFVKRGRATDIVLEAQPAVGWTEASYREATAEDLFPILLPWSSDRRARFRFKGEQYVRAD